MNFERMWKNMKIILRGLSLINPDVAKTALDLMERLESEETNHG